MCQSGKSRFELLGLGGAESLRTRLKEEKWVLEHVPDEGVDDLRFQKQVRHLKVIHVGLAREASDMRDVEELMRTIAQALHPIHRVRAMSTASGGRMGPHPDIVQAALDRVNALDEHDDMPDVQGLLDAESDQ